MLQGHLDSGKRGLYKPETETLTTIFFFFVISIKNIVFVALSRSFFFNMLAFCVGSVTVEMFSMRASNNVCRGYKVKDLI